MQRDRRARNERGALSLEFLLVISALILVFLVMLQYAVTAHARQVAGAAAEEALAATAAYDGSAASGEAAGKHYVDDLGNLTDARVTATRSATTAAVTVTGTAIQLIPFLPVRVSVHLEGPIEQFVESP